VPKLEMFARRKRPGWDVWGAEAPTDTIDLTAEQSAAERKAEYAAEK
jgi:N6-adenosine-specific RNA methylase IME4